MEDSWPEVWLNVVYLVDEVHIFDPRGDVLLQLQKTIPAKTSTTLETPPVLDDESQDLEAANTENDIQGATLTLAPPVEDNSLEIPQPILAEEIFPLVGSASQLELEDEATPGGTLNVYLRVSSRHLTLASPVFKAMLDSDTFAEGNTLQSQGNLIVELLDDPETMIILMHIVHGMTRRVPRRTTLDSLAQLAKLVDYYQLHEVVELFSDIWVANLKQKEFPKSYNPEVVVPWLFISWVFHKVDVFERITRILIRESDDKSLDDIIHKDYPIPTSISDRIQAYRREAIEGIITIVHDYIAKYLTSDILCSEGGKFVCDANVLGSLLKSATAVGIWPRPEVPYHGLTFNSLASKVREMQIIDTCSQRNAYHTYGHNEHKVKETINTMISSLEDQFCGFKPASLLSGTQTRKKYKKTGRKQQKKKKGKGSSIWDSGSDPIDEVLASITLLS